MGNCLYCGRPAGLLKRKHKECESKHHEGWRQLVALSSDAVTRKTSPDGLETRLAKIAQASFVDRGRIKEAMIQGWEQTVEHFLDDGHLDETEEERLSSFASEFSLSQQQQDVHGAWSRLVKGAILRDVLGGKIPERVRVEGNLPFNFQKTEKIIWLFPSTEYYEDRKRRQFFGSTRGVSIRIAKGVYYRAGAFKGHPVETTETVHVGSGPLGLAQARSASRTSISILPAEERVSESDTTR